MPSTHRVLHRRKSHLPAKPDTLPLRLCSPYASLFPKSQPRRKSSLGQRTSPSSHRGENVRKLHLTADLDRFERKTKTPSPTAFFASVPRPRHTPKVKKEGNNHRISLENVLETPREEVDQIPSPAPYTLELEKWLEQYQLYQPVTSPASPLLKLPPTEVTKTSQGSQVEPEPAVFPSHLSPKEPFRSHRRLVPSHRSHKDRSPTPPIL